MPLGGSALPKSTGAGELTTASQTPVRPRAQGATHATSLVPQPSSVRPHFTDGESEAHRGYIAHYMACSR